MTSIVNQPTMVTTQTVRTFHASGWSSGLYSCCEDCGICCCGFWCLPCLMCHTVKNMGECVCLPLLEGCCMGFTSALCGVPCPPVSMAVRATFRERYRIPGSICNDCTVLCCSYSCAWCQMAREIKKRRQNYNIVTAQTTSATTPILMASEPM